MTNSSLSLNFLSNLFECPPFQTSSCFSPFKRSLYYLMTRITSLGLFVFFNTSFILNSFSSTFSKSNNRSSPFMIAGDFFVCFYNPGQNIWHKVEKSSKVGQDFKSLLSNFACFLRAIVKV